MRNVAAQRTVSLIESLKAETDTYNGFQAPQNISRTSTTTTTTTYRENGKTKYTMSGLMVSCYSDAFIHAITNAGHTQDHAKHGRFFRNAITITPDL